MLRPPRDGPTLYAQEGVIPSQELAGRLPARVVVDRSPPRARTRAALEYRIESFARPFVR